MGVVFRGVELSTNDVDKWKCDNVLYDRIKNVFLIRITEQGRILKGRINLQIQGGCKNFMRAFCSGKKSLPDGRITELLRLR